MAKEEIIMMIRSIFKKFLFLFIYSRNYDIIILSVFTMDAMCILASDLTKTIIYDEAPKKRNSC